MKNNKSKTKKSTDRLIFADFDFTDRERERERERERASKGR